MWDRAGDDIILTNQCWFEVQGHELDSFKHVNNSVYLNYLETVRWNFFREFSMMEDLEREKLYPVVIEVNVKYIKELKLFDKFVITSRYWIENNYIVSDHKAVCNDRKSTMMKAKVKMLLVSEDRLVYDIPPHIKEVFLAEEPIIAHRGE
ncbi:acyl-CoA thioesterase [Lacrimispora algidixylanolytica]|uniref:acyl-CoA thioesterase n=1 Tax=Lacrimispora algidixylanolytica TaxID=94868 RepID=UPI000E712D00